MNPFQFLPIHPQLKEIVSQLGVMNINFEESPASPLYRFPWMNSTHLFFPLAGDPLLVKKEHDLEYHAHTSAYFVGPKLLNEIADFGRERYAVGMVFKPGAIHRLVAFPGKELINLDIDATYIFGNSIREVEDKLKEAKSNSEILSIIEQFLFQLLKSSKRETPFDMAMKELLKSRGSLNVEKLASYACQSIRQFERTSLGKLGMSPKLFSRLVRFGNVFSLKEIKPELSWTNIAYEFGYHDQMHLIRDFKMFTGGTPKGIENHLNSSVRMIAALHGKA